MFISDGLCSMVLRALLIIQSTIFCGSFAMAAESSQEPLEEPYCNSYSSTKLPFFGDLHLHTGLSLDAIQYFSAATPVDAYNFAKGGPLTLSIPGLPDRVVQLERKLDFAAVTDHAEWLAVTNVCFDDTNKSLAYHGAYCSLLRKGLEVGGSLATTSRILSVSSIILPNAAIELVYDKLPEVPDWLQAIYDARELSACSVWNRLCNKRELELWKMIKQAAEDANDKTNQCGFTTFNAYEWSGTPLYNNIHRNVIFKNDKTTTKAYGYFDAPTPEILWDKMDKDCSSKKNGCDAIAITHNANLSGGLLYQTQNSDLTPYTKDDAIRRQKKEPLAEIIQSKGASECFFSSVNSFGSTDEDCQFEQVVAQPICAPGDNPQNCVRLCSDMLVPLGSYIGICVEPQDFLRGALRRGLVAQKRVGANPFQFGFIGSTDTHNGTPGHVDEFNYEGGHGSTDATVQQRVTTPITTNPLSVLSFTNQSRYFNPGGLAVVWAEQNTRGALFNAMKRRETYATSGTRITLRMFAGFDLPSNICSSSNYAALGYEKGVPMGGELNFASSDGNRPPVISVSAMKDPGTLENPGNNLQKIQIIKVWESNGKSHEQVFDVAGDKTSNAAPDLETCEPAQGGYTDLCTVWKDPSFDASKNASYYARVLENSSCRYSKRQCNIELARSNLTCETILQDPNHPLLGCCDGKVPDTIKERAWSSPIWYNAKR